MGRARTLFDGIHRRLFAALSLLAPEQQGKLLRLGSARLGFESKPDPWGHAVEPYEAFK
jgi:hypothetical protein